MNTTADTVLMERLRGGDEAALRELIERHRERLYRLAVGLLADRDAAADAVQETFIRLWQHSRRYNPSYTVATWLCTICARRCYDELRRRRRHREAVSEMTVGPVDADTLQSDELMALLRQAVATLPPKQRVVYQLRELEDLSAEQTAKAARMSLAQVKANLWAARNKVRDNLKDYGI